MVFLWLGGPIPIIEMLIHGIMHLPCEGLNLTKAFGENMREKDLVETMKRDYGLVKKLRGYSIFSITDPTIQLSTQILAGKVMRKCCADEVPAPIVSLAAQFANDMQFNW